MKLIIIQGDVDDPRIEPMLARVGCSICELRGKPITVQALPDDNEMVTNEQLLEAMAKWSHEHAATHSDGEHNDHEILQRAIQREEPNLPQLLEAFRKPSG